MKDKTEPDDIKLVDLVKDANSSTMLVNALERAEANHRLPFTTIGEFIAAGRHAKESILKINGIGKNKAEELFKLIEKAISGGPKNEKDLNQIKIIDLLNESNAPKNLVNIILRAKNYYNLPYTTVGEYIDAGSYAKENILKIKGMGKNSAEKLIELIESKIQKGRSNIDLVRNLDKKYPGVFQPLIDEYLSADINDVIKIDKLESYIKDLCSENSRTAEIIWFRFYGETLQSIGEYASVTRERVRQIITPYKQYITDINSPKWAEKSVRYLIYKYDTNNRLPDNKVISNYHPKLPASLIKNFTNINSHKLNPKSRLEIAKQLDLDTEYELSNLDEWTSEKVIFEVKKLAKDIGKPNHMPMQKEMKEMGRVDLRGAVSRFGGQSKVADMAGLKYQGQIVSPDGGRVYWTDERIKEYLHDVAKQEGRPGVMPSTKTVIKYAPNPATIISILTRSSYINEETLSWYDLALRYGLKYERGDNRVTSDFIKYFVKSLGDAIYNLSAAEIYVIFEQQGISKTGNYTYSNRSFDNLVDAIQSGYLPKDEINKWIGEEKCDLVDALLSQENETIEEAFQSAGRKLKKPDHKNKKDNPNDDAYREDVEHNLPVSTVGETLDSLNIATNVLNQASSDSEAVKFLMAKATDKLWKRCFYDEDAALIEANNHKGNAYSESTRDAFIEEYTRCTQYPLPEGYSFTDPTGKKRFPKLMQLLIAYRVLTKKRVLNLSGTGTGKTLSAILASRFIGAKLTVITCPNAIVESWGNNILNAFPDSEVVLKPDKWNIDWKSADKPRYLVINHEMLQDRNEGPIKQFINNNAYDLVVIDELHQVKQRTHKNESQRRRLLTGLITDIPKGRPKPCVLGMSATPIINNLQEGKSLVELVTSLTYEDIGIRPNVPNCMKMYQHFTTLGFRMMPKNDISREPKIYPVDATPLLSELIALGSTPHPQKVEAVLLKARWPVIRNHLRNKTVIFTEYVKDIVPVLAERIKEEGFSVGIYTGDEKLSTSADYDNALHQFMEGTTEVLIASIKTLATGVDGLQYVSNNVIFATLPWTSTDYDQAVGRFDREGFVFEELDIHIPKTYAILSTGSEWSWCDSRLRRLENKRDIAKAAVDGEIPDTESRLTPAKATEYWMNWLKRLNDEGIYEIERKEIKVPLDESNVDVTQSRYARYGDFSRMNSRWNNTHSSKTHERLSTNPEEWSFYHTRLLEQEESWQVIPRDECVNHLKENLPRGSVVGDFGCGLGKLAVELKDYHLVHSFDHISLHPGIVACDFAHTPLDDSILDAAIFSLSLMGVNIDDYIAEAYRTLRLAGQIIIWRPAHQKDRNEFIQNLKGHGFAIVKDDEIYKWHRVWAIKESKH